MYSAESQSNISIPEPVACWEFEKDSNDNINDIQGELIGGAKVEKGMLVLSQDGAYLKTKPLPFHLAEKTLVAQVFLTNLDQRSGGLVTVESLNGVTFDSIVFGEDRARVWCNGSEHGVRFHGAEGVTENASPDQPVWMAITYQKNGQIAIYRNGVPYRPSFNPETPLQKFLKKKTDILIGKRHEGGQNPYLKGKVDFVRIYNEALSDEQVKELYLLTAAKHSPVSTQTSDVLPNQLLFYPHESYSPELLRRAEAGDAQAQVDMGYALAYGKGVEQNYEQSVLWSKKAADQGNANGLYNLGCGYRNGQGVPKDLVKAAEMTRAAAEKGFVIAKDEFAVMLCRGEGVAKNQAEAFQWHLKAATQGWYPAFARVSYHYLKGHGVEQNSVESRRWSELEKMMKNQWEAGDLAKDKKANTMRDNTLAKNKSEGASTVTNTGMPSPIPVAVNDYSTTNKTIIRRRIKPLPAQNSSGSLPASQSNHITTTNPQQNP